MTRKLDDVMVWRMEDALTAHGRSHGRQDWSIVDGRTITHDNVGCDREGIGFAVHGLSSARRRVGTKLNANAMAPQPAALDHCRAAAGKRDPTPLPSSGIAQHQLPRYLRNEVAPVPGPMGT